MNTLGTVIQTCVHTNKQETPEREIACLCFVVALEELLFCCVDKWPEWNLQLGQCGLDLCVVHLTWESRCRSSKVSAPFRHFILKLGYGA